MNQFNWTYLADNGKKHQVSLMHGASSGHLLVYCNTNILLIDFKVLKTSSYSFFIEEELCELTIERQGNRFSYGFKINRNADTPLNQKRRKLDKKHLLQSLMFLGGLLLLVSMLIVGLTHYHNNKEEAQLLEKLVTSGMQTQARILMTPETEGSEVSYLFFVNGRTYSVAKDFADQKTGKAILLDTGMPLEAGDEFTVRYLPSVPTFSEIDFSQPSPETIQKYKDRALNIYKKRQTDLPIQRCNCHIEVAYQLNGIKALADIYFANTPKTVNPKHNEDSFLRLIRDLPFQKEIDKKCSFL